MFVGREMGIWEVIIGMFFFSLFDECILRAFILAFSVKN